MLQQKANKIKEGISEHSFYINKERYTLLKFDSGNGPDLHNAVKISEERDERMLTVEEAENLLADPKAKASLSRELSAEEKITWSYLRTPAYGHIVASIGNSWESRGLRTMIHADFGNYRSPILLLKESNPAQATATIHLKNVLKRE